MKQIIIDTTRGRARQYATHTDPVIVHVNIGLKALIGLCLVLSLCLITACERTTAPQPAPPQPGSIGDEWRHHGATPHEQRHAAHTQITPANITGLGLAFAHEFDSSRGIEATPIMQGRTLYVTSTWNIVTALDAVTGEIQWVFDPEVDRSKAAHLCCGVVNRGVAYADGRVIAATIDGRLIALDAETGNKIWDILTIDPEMAYTITGAPRIIGQLVIIGNGGGEYGVRGYVTAFDIETGEEKWRFYTVPGDPADGFENDAMAAAAKTWTGEWWRYGGGGTVWDSIAYDPALGLVYLGTGNGSPWNHAIRSPEGGDNLYLSSIVALEAESGEYVWHYQTTPGDTWDYTATQHMILADLDIDGVTRKVIMQAPKNGFFYVIDRTDGTFISAENFVETNWATAIDPETGRPVETKHARWGEHDREVMIRPGSLGAHNWHPMAFHPGTGLVYIPAQEIPSLYGAEKDFSFTPGHWNTGSDLSLQVAPSDPITLRLMRNAVTGRLIAWDPVTQRPRWQHLHDGPWNGGVLATGSADQGLVFQGTADGYFKAYDAASGEVLWQFYAQTGISAAPISYQVDGTQYIAIAASWAGAYTNIAGGSLPASRQQQHGRLLVFKLGGTASLSAPTSILRDAPVIEASLDVPKEVLAQGQKFFGQRCAACHGSFAASGENYPSLQHSISLQNEEAWRAIVHDGALAPNGMPGFADIFDEEATEAIRAYILKEAQRGRPSSYYEKFAR